MLKRRMKIDVRDVYSGSNRHAKRLDGPIEILVVERVFIVPDARSGIGHFIAHEPDAIGSRRGLDLVYHRTGPSSNAGLLSHGGPALLKLNGWLEVGPNNPSSYTDSTGARGHGSFIYKVCNAGTQTCSNQVTVSF